MPNAFAVYVSSNPTGRKNLEGGLTNLVWGWRDSVLDKANHRAIAEQIRPGDLLVMGTGGPNPRVAAGGWSEARLARVVLARFTSSLRQGSDLVWADEQEAGVVLYPNRADFRVVYDVQAPEVVDLEPELLEALRWSANTQGSPVPLALGEGRVPRFTVRAESQSGGVIDHEGGFDALTEVLVRREQRKLRRQKFGDRTHLTCALCGKTLPARLVRAAHIKRRSQCTPEQLIDLANVMPACTLGCDELFEHGYVAVDQSSEIVAHRPSTGDLLAVVQGLVGRRCLEHGPRSQGYFAWHLADHQVLSAEAAAVGA